MTPADLRDAYRRSAYPGLGISFEEAIGNPHMRAALCMRLRIDQRLRQHQARRASTRIELTHGDPA